MLPTEIVVDACNDYVCRRELTFDPPVTRAAAAKVIRSQPEQDWIVERTAWKHREGSLVISQVVLVRAAQKSEGGKGGVAGTAVQEVQKDSSELQLSLPSQKSEADARVEEILAHFRTLSTRNVTPRDRDVLLELLPSFSTFELCLALTVSYGERPGHKISTLLRSAKRVRQLLGKPEPKVVTWLTPFWDAWKERYGGDLPGVAAKVLKPLVDTHGADAVLAEFLAYIAQTDINYTSLPKFSSGFGSWDSQRRFAKPDRRATDLLPGGTSQAFVF